MQKDGSQDCIALLATEKECSMYGTYPLWAQIPHSLSYVMPSVPQTGFRFLGQDTNTLPSSVVAVGYLLQSVCQNKEN